MRVSLDWLAEFTDLPPEPELVDRLSMCGFEDVLVERGGPDLSAIRVGRVESCEPHPNADKLSVCEVDVGEGEPLQIVCGAPNVAAGQKVPVAVPGVRLPDGTKIKRSKLRGVASAGMICSRRELTLGDEHTGILVLSDEAQIGAPLSDAVAAGEAVLEVGITPNRGDAASLLGLAREVKALFGAPLRLPASDPPESGSPAVESVRIRVDAPEGCYRYVGRVVRGVRVGASPDWMSRRLEASGIRAINNVVDVTNWVLLEFGQPLHAFDLQALRGAEIRARSAASGETLATLDGTQRELDPRDLVIADAERPVALAGVMGGADTEVGPGTTDILIESAHFDPSTVRLTARRHGLHTEASYRFERGVDRDGVARAADRAARLVAELAGGEVAPGRVEARGDSAPRTGPIRLEVARSNRLLGIDLSGADAAELLGRVEVACDNPQDGVLECRIPSHRNDLQVHQDLTEEIARIYGYDRIPTTLPVAELRPVRLPWSWEVSERVRDALSACGLMEMVSLPFVAPRDLARLRLAEDDPRRRSVRVLNPIQEQDSQLRTAILPSLLRIARQNLSRQVDRVGLFEVCRVFLAESPERGEKASNLPQEPLCVTALLTRGEERPLWSPDSAPPLFFEARGVAERLLSALGYMASLQRGSGEPYLHPGAEASIVIDGCAAGVVGELHPEVAAAFDIGVPCALIELNLSAVRAVERREIQFQEVSREPRVRRDLAVLVDRDQAAGEVLEAIRGAGGADLVSAELFDRYEGRGVPQGRVSLAFRMVFQRADRTLTDEEVARATDRVVRTLTRRFGVELR